MPDLYSAITTVDPATVERLARVLEMRAADGRQSAMRREFLDAIPLPARARVVEIGCGTGLVCRELAALPAVAEVVGVDPAEAFLARGRELAAGLPSITFLAADGGSIPLPDAAFDAVVFHTTLCHVPEPDRALAEAFRLLRGGGWLAVFDGDYSTTSVATTPHDPLQACADAAMAALVNDRWLVRRLPAMVRRAGFLSPRAASHGYAGIDQPEYLITVIERGADALAGAGSIGAMLCAALKEEARQRVADGRFFGQIAYFSLIGRKPE
jgi:ubiquinone/menaquinone biosynthesis C-methylase UbiE